MAIHLACSHGVPPQTTRLLCDHLAMLRLVGHAEHKAEWASRTEAHDGRVLVMLIAADNRLVSADSL